jgi:hypothetical protein
MHKICLYMYINMESGDMSVLDLLSTGHKFFTVAELSTSITPPKSLEDIF